MPRIANTAIRRRKRQEEEGVRGKQAEKDNKGRERRRMK